MKTELDTVHKALIILKDRIPKALYALEVPSRNPYDAYPELKDAELALAALSTIEADANATKVGHYFCAQMPCSPSDCTEVPCQYMKDAIANRNNHDDAIRRECAEKLPTEQEIIELMRSRGVNGIATVKLAALDISRRIKSAILGTEPVREELK